MRSRLRENNKVLHYLRALLRASEVCIVLVSLGIIVSTFFVSVLHVRGTSMEPMLSPGELVISSHSDDFQQGDLVAFYYNNRLLLKRVIAFPGDVVDITNEGEVFVNGTRLREDYLEDVSLGETNIELPYTVPENRYFVLGDKRSVSVDSRSTVLGAIPEEQVVGRLLMRVWPLGKITLFE